MKDVDIVDILSYSGNKTITEDSPDIHNTEESTFR